MSLALPSIGKLGVAISIVGPSHRFADGSLCVRAWHRRTSFDSSGR